MDKLNENQKKAKGKDVPYEVLNELLDADFETGELRWKERDIKWFSHCKEPVSYSNSWNSKYANSKVGTQDNGYTNVRLCCAGVNKAKLHRIIYAMYYKINLKDVPHTLDHIDGNRQNNSISNLRAITTSNNVRNYKRKENTAGYIGVSYKPKNKKWEARSSENCNHIYLGIFTTPELAFVARLEYELDNNLFQYVPHTKEAIDKVRDMLSLEYKQKLFDNERTKEYN